MSCRYIYIAGDQSGVGKSSVCLSLLSMLQTVYQPHELAYIKPATQCEEIGLIAKYCHESSIECRSIGPVVFDKGFTQECIEQQLKDIEQLTSQSQSSDQSISQLPSVVKRHNSIKQAVEQISKNKKLVLIDGVGYPAVGSVCGISNADVARLLGAPVICVSRAGVGNAIDATNYMRDYFRFSGCTVLGVIYNKIPIDVSNDQATNQSNTQEQRHTAAGIREYTTKYFKHIAKPRLSVYGHLPHVRPVNQSTGESIAATEKVCMIRPAEVDLQMNEDDRSRMEAFKLAAKQYLDFHVLMQDLDRHYGQ